MNQEPQRPTNQTPMGQAKPNQPTVAKWLWITLIIVAILGGFFLAWYLLLGPGKTTEVTTTTTTPAVVDATADWKTYTNTTYGFSFKYPSDWKVNDDSKGDVYLSDTKKVYTSEGSDMAPIVIQYIVDTSGADINKHLSNAAMKAILKSETVKIGGQTAYVVQGSTPPVYHDTRIIFYKNNVISFSSNGTFLKAQDTTSSINTTFDKLLGTVKFTTTAAATSGTTATTTTTTTTTDLTYTNAQYGFSLTLPATWKGYKMKEATIEGITATYYINIPTTDTSFQGDTSSDAGYYSPFAISVYTLDQWQAAQAAEGPKDTLIIKNDTYAFAWSQANGIPPSGWDKNADINTIIASFKLK